MNFLLTQFSTRVQPQELKWFYNAVTGRTSDFHDQSIYSRIQVKLYEGKVTCIALKEGIPFMYHRLEHIEDWFLKIPGKPSQSIHLTRDPEEIHSDIQMGSQMFLYEINNWFALNDDDYVEKDALFRDLAYYEKDSNNRIYTDESFRQFLEEILIKQINYLLKEINGHPIPPTVYIQLLPQIASRLTNFKNIFPSIYHIYFATNLDIPDFLGIGNKTAIGFGSIRSKRML